MVGSLNGAFANLLGDAPLRMHCVQALTDLFVPLDVVILIACKFGLNCRREMPVTLVPTRLSTWLYRGSLLYYRAPAFCHKWNTVET